MCKQVLWPSFHNIDMLDMSTSGFGDNPAFSEAAQADAPSIWDQSRLHKQWWEVRSAARSGAERSEATMLPTSVIVSNTAGFIFSVGSRTSRST